MNGTAKCPICGKPYRWYSHTIADQTACPSCVQAASGGSLRDRVSNASNG